VDSALLRFLTVQWRNLPLIVYWLFQFKSFHVFSHGYSVLSISVSRVSFIVHQSWPTAGGETCNSDGYDARCCFTAPFHLQCRATKSEPSQTRLQGMTDYSARDSWKGVCPSSRVAERLTNFHSHKGERNRRIRKGKEEIKEEEWKERDEKIKYGTKCLYLIWENINLFFGTENLYRFQA